MVRFMQKIITHPLMEKIVVYITDHNWPLIVVLLVYCLVIGVFIL